MKTPTNFQYLTIIMAIAMLVVTAIATIGLYDTAFSQHREHLIDAVKSQARLIEAIAQFNNHHIHRSDSWRSDTLAQITDAHVQSGGFGSTGEFILARKSGDSIELVSGFRQHNKERLLSIPFDESWAQPIRLALFGESGSIVGYDYRGNKVLTAFEPVSKLNYGLIAKIDLTEIRAPFFRAGLISLAAAILVIIISSAIFLRITQPIARKLKLQAEVFRTLVETTKEGVILIDTNGIIQFVNPAVESLFGYGSNELIGSNISRLASPPHAEAHDGYIAHYLKTGRGKIIGTGRQLTAVRKNGSHFPIHLSVGEIDLHQSHLFAGMIIDMSEQLQLQRQIMEIPVREQRRIGEELHDGIGQQLTGLGMLATSLLNKASLSEHALANQLSTGLKEALAQVRSLSRGLVLNEVDAASSLESAIHLLADEIESQSHIPIKLNISNTCSLCSDNTAAHLYRVIQEALNNAVKHSGASVIKVFLGIEHERGLLKVEDDGCGIQDGLDSVSGLGLRIMKHRSTLFGGDFSVASAEEGGTLVSCHFPLYSNEEKN